MTPPRLATSVRRGFPGENDICHAFASSDFLAPFCLWHCPVRRGAHAPTGRRSPAAPMPDGCADPEPHSRERLFAQPAHPVGRQFSRALPARTPSLQLARRRRPRGHRKSHTSGKVVSIALWTLSFFLLQAIWRRILIPSTAMWANVLFVVSPLDVFYGQLSCRR